MNRAFPSIAIKPVFLALLVLAPPSAARLGPVLNAQGLYPTGAPPTAPPILFNPPDQPLASWFRGGFAGKKIVVWGNSTVSNAIFFFDELCRQTAAGGALAGIECRTDLRGVQADRDETVTVTLAAPVAYRVGQWVSPRFNNPQNQSHFWAPSVQVSAVSGSSFSYKRRGAPATPFTPDSGRVSGAILDFGSKGAALSVLLNTTGPFSATGVCNLAPDLLIVRGPLINDVRLGQVDLAKAELLEKKALDQFASCAPSTAILLTTENSLLTSDTGQHWVQPNGSAQQYTDILHDAVISMTGKYPNVQVVDVMTAVYGRACPPSSPLMANQLHPNAAGQTKEAQFLLGVIGKR